jgi:hypothetical protein
MMNFLDVLFFMMVLVESKNVDCRSFTSHFNNNEFSQVNLYQVKFKIQEKLINWPGGIKER